MKEKNANKAILAAFIGFAAIVIAASYYALNPGSMILEGQVEVTQVKVASKITGRVENIFVKEGDLVKKGEALVFINSPEISAKYEQALGAQKAAVAQRSKAFRGARDEEVRAARENWMRAQSAADLAQKTFDRVESLYKDGVMPEQKYDEAKTQLDVAKRGSDAARAAYDMASSGARLEDKQSAQALLDQASGMVAEVRAYLGETRLTAPLGGEVVEILAEQGEIIAQGYPIMTIADMGDMWITFNVREDKLQGVKIGDLVDVKFPALKNEKLSIRINYIAALGDYATWRAARATGDFDLKTFEIRGVPVKAENLRPGMTALIDWDDAIDRIEHKRKDEKK